MRNTLTTGLFAAVFNFASFTAFGDKPLDPVQLNADCAAFATSFGKIPVTFSYKAWNGETESRKALLLPETGGCVASENRWKLRFIKSPGLSPEFLVTVHFTMKSDGKAHLEPSRTFSGCYMVVPDGTVASLKASGNSMTQAQMDAVRKNMADALCPAFERAAGLAIEAKASHK